MEETIIWHYHHLIPKHEGGTDDKSNLLKCNIAMHAFLHHLRFLETGKWQDKLAYEGLIKLKIDCHREAIRQGGLKGCAKTNGGFFFTDGVSVVKYMPGTEPKGWVRASKKQSSRQSYINNIRKEKDTKLDGRKTRKNRYWFNNGLIHGQFDLENPPEGWKRGRLKNRV